jgi:hypothetical protein
MKKILFSFIILSFSLVFGSCKKCGHDEIPDYNILNFLVKSGSYFIYSDSTDHIIDSEYVYKYTYAPGQGTGNYSEGNCNYTTDWVYMCQSSYRNGLFYDSIFSLLPDFSYLYMYDSKSYLFGGGTIQVYPPTGPDPDSFFHTNFFVGGQYYPKVLENELQVGITENNDTIPISLYFAPNYGIVKRVEHRATGDVSWDLIRYHISN